MQSKLPNTQTSIFSVMSALAVEKGALNMAQGFPDFSVSEKLIDRVTYHMKKGRNQYPPAMGIPALREAIAGMHAHMMKLRPDADREITITTGATEALFCAISALIHPGDEVIVFDPAYDSYEPVIQLQQAKAIHVRLTDGAFEIPWDEVKAKITARTKAIIVNTPHNPTGMVMTDADMKMLESIACSQNLFVISDEVYNHMVYDGIEHRSVLQYPDLAKRSVAIYSFGKTFHATGWKMGYAVAPPELTQEIRKIHQFVTFTTHTPGQFAIADYLNDVKHYTYLPAFFQEKRDLFLNGIASTRFKAIPSKGTYFQLISYEGMSGLKDVELARKWTEEHKIATIPVSVFNDDGHDGKYLRICFAKENETIERACEILRSI
jgi:methionine aminotransferase